MICCPSTTWYGFQTLPHFSTVCIAFKGQLLTFRWLHWMQLCSSFKMSQKWASTSSYWPRTGIFRGPSCRQLPQNYSVCHLLLAHHPTHANTIILVVAATNAGPNLFPGHLDNILYFWRHNQGVGPNECGIFGSRWDPSWPMRTKFLKPN